MTLWRLWAGLALLGASCTTPAPRIPFDVTEGFHVSAVASQRRTDDDHHREYPTIGLEFVTQAPGTAGWGWEAGGLYATDTATSGGVQRSSDFYELSIGTRQTFRPGAALQPYVGVGGMVSQVNTKERSGGDLHHDDEAGLGLYLRTGLRANLLRDTFRKATEVILSVDVRGLYGGEYSFVELGFGLGFGR